MAVCVLLASGSMREVIKQFGGQQRSIAMFHWMLWQFAWCLKKACKLLAAPHLAVQIMTYDSFWLFSDLLLFLYLLIFPLSSLHMREGVCVYVVWAYAFLRNYWCPSQPRLVPSTSIQSFLHLLLIFRLHAALNNATHCLRTNDIPSCLEQGASLSPCPALHKADYSLPNLNNLFHLLNLLLILCCSTATFAPSSSSAATATPFLTCSSKLSQDEWSYSKSVHTTYEYIKSNRVCLQWMFLQTDHQLQ